MSCEIYELRTWKNFVAVPFVPFFFFKNKKHKQRRNGITCTLNDVVCVLFHYFNYFFITVKFFAVNSRQWFFISY